MEMKCGYKTQYPCVYIKSNPDIAAVSPNHTLNS